MGVVRHKLLQDLRIGVKVAEERRVRQIKMCSEQRARWRGGWSGVSVGKMVRIIEGNGVSGQARS